jgi:GNAT superfamily N-acetyltransferase
LAHKIRPMNAYDVGEVVALAQAMSDESEKYRKQGFNRERTTQLATCLCLRLDRFIGYVAENDEGELVGMIALIVADSLTHDVRYATDIAVFVKPELRGTSAAIRLIKAAEQEALEKYHVDEVHLGISTGIMPERTVHIYERLGYKMSSYGLVKEV